MNVSSLLERHSSVKSIKSRKELMVSRTDTALDRLNHIIDTTFSSVEKFEPVDRFTTLQLLYTARDRQLQDGMMGQQEFVHCL